MAFKSKYTGAQVEELLDKINDVESIINNVIVVTLNTQV